MSDILLHASITENQKTLKTWVKNTIDPDAIWDVEWFACNKRAGWPIRGKIWSNFEHSSCPIAVQKWEKYLKPIVKTHTNGFLVCDGSGYYRCGANCNWTVPTGVTSVQFQLWAPGGGNSGQCCCGGTPFGASGGYMISTVPVTAGEIYCLCAGCAYCCYANQTTPGMCGGPTWISATTGYSVCVDSATADMYAWIADVNTVNPGNCQIPNQDSCGPESCGGWNYCWDSGNDNLYIPHAFSSATWNVLCAKNSVNYGVPGMYPSLCIGSNLYCSSCQFSAPVFGFEGCTCKMYVWPSMCDGYGGCHYSAQNGYQQIPAMGGYGGYVCGGYSSGCGDAGGMGMICVSYNCN